MYGRLLKVLSTQKMSLDSLRVFASNTPKIRIGSNSDGGYVIADGHMYDGFISCGIDTNVDFERDFLAHHPSLHGHGYDGTIKTCPSVERLTFHPINIGSENTTKTTNLQEEIKEYKSIFLKMDIETYEYRWLLSLTEEQLNKFKQIVIEFHFPFSEPGFKHLDTPLPVETKMSVFAKLAQTHTLIHLHANNCCGTTVYSGITVPNVFECTYVRNDVQDRSVMSKDPIPGPLDRPNTHNPEIFLRGYPFMN
jgi:hypothetical protein